MDPDPDPDPTAYPTPFFIDFKEAKNTFFTFLLITFTEARHSLQSKKFNFLLKF
jgi:hypothetical protein